MPKKLPRRWRGVFLRALARSGNVRQAARDARVDPGTAYDHRIKDGAFAAKWAAALRRCSGQALAKARARPSPRPSPRSGRGSELVARHWKRHGTQWVRAAEGRWSEAAETAFLAELERSGCVRGAARAAGLSTTALYRRRKIYADFAARWAGSEARARERIPALLHAAAIASLDPDVEPEEGLPIVSVDQAIAFLKLKGGLGGGEGKASRYAPPEPSIEEVRDEVLRRLEAIRRHRAQGGGADGEGGSGA